MLSFLAVNKGKGMRERGNRWEYSSRVLIGPKGGDAVHVSSSKKNSKTS